MIFAWITYESRRHRDEVNAKVMADDRMKALVLASLLALPAMSAPAVAADGLVHFYVLGQKRDADGVLSYRVAVRSLDGAGPATRGVAATDGDASPASPGRVAVQRFQVTNTASGEDLIRVNATTADGWTTTLRENALDVPAGWTVTVPVYVTVPSDLRGRRSTTLTFTASSETDPGASVSKTATVTRVRGGKR